MLLQTLATLGPLHGYSIAARLEQVSGGVLRINMGTLYPGLMRLEQRGLVRAEDHCWYLAKKAAAFLGCRAPSAARDFSSAAAPTRRVLPSSRELSARAPASGISRHAGHRIHLSEDVPVTGSMPSPSSRRRVA